MDSSPNNSEDWLREWLAKQRKFADEWRSASEAERVELTRRMTEALWQGVNANGSEHSRATLRRLQETTQALLAGSGYFMQTLTDMPTLMEIPHRTQQMLKAVPLGLLREQQIALRELLQAAEEHQATLIRIARSLSELESQAIELLTQRASTLSNSGTATDNGRALYDLWVDCAEEIFAKLAHDPDFVRLLGESANSFARLRKRQRALLEYLLRQFDLPTRTELNSMHRKLKELSARVDAMAASPSPRARAKKPASKKRQRS